MSQEIFETYRVNGDFQLAMSNLEKLARLKHKLKADKPRFEWQYLVFSFNEHELPRAIRHARRIGVDFRPAAPYVALNLHPDWLSTQGRFVREPYKAAMASRKGGSMRTAEALCQPAGEEAGIPASDGVEEEQRLTSGDSMSGGVSTPGAARIPLRALSASRNPTGWPLRIARCSPGCARTI